MGLRYTSLKGKKSVPDELQNQLYSSWSQRDNVILLRKGSLAVYKRTGGAFPVVPK